MNSKRGEFVQLQDFNDASGVAPQLRTEAVGSPADSKNSVNVHKASQDGRFDSAIDPYLVRVRKDIDLSVV